MRKKENKNYYFSSIIIVQIVLTVTSDWFYLIWFCVFFRHLSKKRNQVGSFEIQSFETWVLTSRLKFQRLSDLESWYWHRNLDFNNHSFYIKAEIQNRGGAGTHIAAKLSLACVTFWLLNAKLQKLNLSTWFLLFT